MLMWGNPRGSPLVQIGPRSPSGDSGFAYGRSGYRGSGIPNGHQWTPESHLEAWATVFRGDAVFRRWQHGTLGCTFVQFRYVERN
jgi:hypothetical protein